MQAVSNDGISIELNYGNKSDSSKKIEKNVFQEWWIYLLMVKSILKCFGYIKPSSEKVLLENR